MNMSELKVSMIVKIDSIPCIVKSINSDAVTFEITEGDMVNEKGDIMTLDLDTLNGCIIEVTKFQKLLNFMQEHDGNGDWLTGTTKDAQVILDTLRDWIEYQDLDLTLEVENYITYLKELI